MKLNSFLKIITESSKDYSLSFPKIIVINSKSDIKIIQDFIKQIGLKDIKLKELSQELCLLYTNSLPTKDELKKLLNEDVMSKSLETIDGIFIPNCFIKWREYYYSFNDPRSTHEKPFIQQVISVPAKVKGKYIYFEKDGQLKKLQMDAKKVVELYSRTIDDDTGRVKSILNRSEIYNIANGKTDLPDQLKDLEKISA